MRNFVKTSDVISTSSPPESLKKKKQGGVTHYTCPHIPRKLCFLKYGAKEPRVVHRPMC